MSTRKTRPRSSTGAASPRGPLRKRLSAAIQVLVHGECPLQGPLPPLDPRIVAGINHYADVIADAYGDPLAGSFARDILTDSAYVIVDSLGDSVMDESMREADVTDATADLLVRGRRGPT